MMCKEFRPFCEVVTAGVVKCKTTVVWLDISGMQGSGIGAHRITPSTSCLIQSVASLISSESYCTRVHLFQDISSIKKPRYALEKARFLSSRHGKMFILNWSKCKHWFRNAYLYGQNNFQFGKLVAMLSSSTFVVVMLGRCKKYPDVALKTSQRILIYFFKNISTSDSFMPLGACKPRIFGTCNSKEESNNCVRFVQYYTQHSVHSTGDNYVSCCLKRVVGPDEIFHPLLQVFPWVYKPNLCFYRYRLRRTRSCERKRDNDNLVTGWNVKQGLT